MLTWKIFKAFHLQCLWNFSHLPKPMRGRDLRCDRNRLNFLICFSQLRKETMRGIGNSLFILSPLVSNWSHCQPNKIVWQYYQQTGLILNEVIFLQRWGKKLIWITNWTSLREISVSGGVQDLFVWKLLNESSDQFLLIIL